MPQLKRALSRAATAPSKRPRARSSYAKRSLTMPHEYKTFLTSVSASALTAAVNMSSMEKDPVALNCLNAMTQGTSENTRIGRTVKNISLEVKGVIRVNMDDGQSSVEKPHCFVALVRDKRTAGAQLNSEDVYVNTAAAARTIPAALRNPDFRQRFDVLAFKRIEWFEGNIPSGNSIAYFDWYVHLNDTTNYNANAGSVADINDLSYHVLAGTTDATIGTAGDAELSYNAKLTFEG